MFNWFKKKSAKRSSGSNNISDEDAQNIVYAFIDLMDAGAPYIGDASILPYPKDTLKSAFAKHIEHYEGMRKISEELYRSKGYDEIVKELQVMAVRINDWHDIDSEDLEAVRKLNKIQGIPPEWAMPLIAKYMH